MERNLGLKLAAIVALVVLLLVGLLWIGSTVNERQARRDQVVRDIAESSSHAQRLIGFYVGAILQSGWRGIRSCAVDALRNAICAHQRGR